MSNTCQLYVNHLSTICQPFVNNHSSTVYQPFVNHLLKVCQLFVKFVKHLWNICPLSTNVCQLFVNYLSTVYQLFVNCLSTVCQLFDKWLSNVVSEQTIDNLLTNILAKRAAIIWGWGCSFLQVVHWNIHTPRSHVWKIYAPPSPF